MFANPNTPTHNAHTPCLESAPDPHVLHDACDRAMLASLEAFPESPEPTHEALEATRAMLEGMGVTLLEEPVEYAPDAATVQADRDHEGICEMLLEAPPVDWDALLPKRAVWIDEEPVEAHGPAPKVRDTAPMFDAWTPDDPEMFLAAMELANATHPHPEDQARNDAQFAAVESYLEEEAEFAPAPDAAELAELRARGLDPAFCHIIGAACSA